MEKKIPEVNKNQTKLDESTKAFKEILSFLKEIRQADDINAAYRAWNKIRPLIKQINSENFYEIMADKSNLREVIFTLTVLKNKEWQVDESKKDLTYELQTALEHDIQNTFSEKLKDQGDRGKGFVSRIISTEPIFDKEREYKKLNVQINNASDISMAKDFLMSPVGFFPKQAINLDLEREKPSLEQIHELYYNLQKYKKQHPEECRRNYSQLMHLENSINEFCQFQYNETVDKIPKGLNSHTLEDTIGNSVNNINKLLLKDPQSVAKLIHQASQQSQKLGNNENHHKLTSSDLYDTLLHSCSPAQIYKITKIGDKLEKLENNKESQKGFKASLKSFCMSFFGIVISKYRVNDKDLMLAYKDIELHYKTLVENGKIQPAFPKKEVIKEASKPVIGKFTQKFASVMEAKIKRASNSSQKL